MPVSKEGFLLVRTSSPHPNPLPQGEGVRELQEKRIGITVYDEASGEPYCMKVRGGQVVSEAGECQLAMQNTITNNQETITNSQSISNEPITQTATTTDATTQTTEPAPSESVVPASDTAPADNTIQTTSEPAASIA